MTADGPLPVADVRLAPALALLADPAQGIEVLSLDVFDTLLWRLVPEPVDAFPLLGRRLIADGLVEPVEPDVFAQIRRGAELRARARHPNPLAPEVTVEEIYAELPAWLRGGTDAGALAAAELDFEASITVPDLDVVALARVAHDTYGCRVALTSDIYFSEDQLRALVDRPAFDGLPPLEVVATSSCRRTGKGQELFLRLLDDLGVDGERVLHVGDNALSDVAAPARFGIRTVHYHKYPGELARVVDRETGVREGHIYRKAPRVHPELGDSGLTALRAKAGTQYDGATLAVELVPHWQFGATVPGPLFAAFAEWVAERATERGATRVHCLMREGEFLARLIDEVDGVEAVPLWASRRAMAEATIASASADELREVVWRRRPPTVEQFLTTVGLSVADVAPAPELRVRRMDDEDVRSVVFEAIVRDEELQRRIVAHSAVKRRNLVTYLADAIGPFPSELVVVDLGWGATIQTLLDKVFELEGIKVSTFGLYLVTTEGTVDRILGGTRAFGFVASAGTPETVSRWITRSPEVLEQICMSDLGSLIGVDESGATLHAPNDDPPQQRAERKAVQDGVVAFQRLWMRYRPLLPPGCRRLSDRAGDHLRAILLRLVVEPMPSEARLFAHWLHDENFGSGEAEEVVASELASMGDHMTPTQFLSLPMTRVYWPFGLAALYSEPLALAAATVAADVAPAGAFESAAVLDVLVDIDAGGGYHRAWSSASRTNVNGLRFVRVDFYDTARSVRFVFGHRPAVIRLDAVRVAFHLRDGRVETTLASSPDELSAVTAESGLRVAPNVLVGAAAAPAVSWHVPPGAEAFRIEIEVAFAYLETPTLGLDADLATDVVKKGARAAARRARRLLGGP
jgi:hypothetical protein